MAMKATRDEAMQFVSRAPGGPACCHCGRNLGATYLLRDTRSGDERPYGRRCASRILGWATSRVEMAAVNAERWAELERRREAMYAAYPQLREVWNTVQEAARARREAGLAIDVMRVPDAYYAINNVANAWWLWTDRETGEAREDWREAIESQAPEVAA